MHPLLRNLLALIGGLIVGSIVNMALIKIGGMVIPNPPGSDNSTMEGLDAMMQLFEPRHFIFPFLAHALGTLAGAYLTARLAVSQKMSWAMGVGIFFLVGGIYMVYMVSSPLWFTLLDLIGAYIPMAFIGGKLALKRGGQQM